MGKSIKDTVRFIADPVGIFGLNSPKVPSVQQTSSVSPMPQTPIAADSSVAQAAEEERRKRRAATGAYPTLLSGANTLGQPATQKKTLLGG